MPLYGLLAETNGYAAAAVLLILILAAGFRGAPLWAWTAGTALSMWLLGASVWLWVPFVPLAALFNLKQLRRKVITDKLLALAKQMRLFPVISETERTAIEAGDVWVDGELFSGRPNLQHLNNAPYPDLTKEERAFLEGPVQRVCAMVDDWEVTCNRDLPDDVWDFLKREGFFGMIIPKKYGGQAFSASAHSAIVAKLASHSLPLAITVMVPNSLGPAELLVHGGTREQKDHYLPRLARGEEIPCFALTEPGAGSDAAAMTSTGVVFRGDDEELYIRLNWDKRYITLAAISTVLGLAFKLQDPDNLLGKGENRGITCALIPSTTEGVVLGKRHDPLGIAFYNCPTQGKDVVVPVSAIIGGAKGAGEGWRMLMECLSAGRGISLPATATGGAKMVARAASAHAVVRKQFGLSIGKFEGIEEPLARIGGLTYLMEAARRYTLGSLDSGVKPPVVTAMMKYNFTELFRQIINDGMDILGGAAISRGPNNILAESYIGSPISITVEGANILTRTLMVFGQGAIRCHPFALREIEAATNNDKRAFDEALWGHVGHVGRNTFRSVMLSLSRGRLAASPVSGPTAPYWRKLAWTSARFALLSDVAMGALGGDLKRKEKLTGRYADVFSWMYLASATLRRFHADGQKKSDLPFMRWACDHAFHQIQIAIDGIYQNLKVPGMSWLLRGPASWMHRLNPIGTAPSDRCGSQVARGIQELGEAREALCNDSFTSGDPTRGLGRLEHAMQLCSEAEPVIAKVKQAIREKKLPKAAPAALLAQALEAEILVKEELDTVRRAERARAEAMAVDDFELEEYLDMRRAAETCDETLAANPS